MKYTSIILLFITFLMSCQNKELNPEDLSIADRAAQIIEVSKKHVSAGSYDLAIINTVDAINLLKSMEQPDHKKLYLYYRNQANFAHKIEKHDLAVTFLDSALIHLPQVDRKAFGNLKKEEISTKKFMAQYLYLSGDYIKSTNVVYELMPKAEEVTGLYQQLKNQLGLIHLKLENYQEAERHFLDLQKISALDSVDRAFYFSNLAKVYSRDHQESKAITSINQALAWMPVNSKNSLYRFRVLRDAGRYQLQQGRPQQALAYFEQANDVYQNIDLSPDLFDIHRQHSAAYYALNEFDIAQEMDNNYEKALNDWELSSKRVDAVFSQSWLQSKHAEFKKEQHASFLMQRIVRNGLLYAIAFITLIGLICIVVRLRQSKLSSILK